jgi:murein DD-endopeptidase MepM/ murein hydrolase activator NlpD
MLVVTLLLGTVGGAAPPARPAAPAALQVIVYRAPLAGDPTVAHPFEAPAHRWSAGHRGVDLDAAAGSPVLAPGAGVITFAGEVAGRPVLTVTHPDGLRSSLEPVRAIVGTGTHVVAGDVVGICLHWGVRSGTNYLDPWSLLVAPGPVVLLAGSASPGFSRPARPRASGDGADPSRPCASGRPETR